jgi:hypothetical protein
MAQIKSKSKPDLPAKLHTVEVHPSELFRISRHQTGEPYFGKWNQHRFDDPNKDAAARYGTCYLGTSFPVAVAESLLHDKKPVNGGYVVSADTIEQSYLIRYDGSPLTLADLTGTALKLMGGLADLTGSTSYTRSKQWSADLHKHPDKVDGLYYMSRHLTGEKAVVLFDRAASKISMTSATSLGTHPDFGRVARSFNIRGA